MEKAKRVVWRLLAASVCVMAVSQAVHADSLDEQRNRYAQIKQAWDNKQMDTVQALMPTDYFPTYKEDMEKAFGGGSCREIRLV